MHTSMQPDTLAILFSLFALFASGSATNSIPSTTNAPPTNTCYTLTTAGPTCAQASCPIPACLKLSTITQSCGCPSIYTALTCTNSCTNDCAGTSYQTLYLPCPTSPSNSTTKSPGTSYGNSTASTTSLPGSSGTGGGSGGLTVTSHTTTTPGATTPGNTGPRPTTSLVEANMAGRSLMGEGGVLVGLFVAVLGML